MRGPSRGPRCRGKGGGGQPLPVPVPHSLCTCSPSVCSPPRGPGTWCRRGDLVRAERPGPARPSAAAASAGRARAVTNWRNQPGSAGGAGPARRRSRRGRTGSAGGEGRARLASPRSARLGGHGSPRHGTEHTDRPYLSRRRPLRARLHPHPRPPPRFPRCQSPTQAVWKRSEEAALL